MAKTVWVTIHNTSKGSIALELRYLKNRGFVNAMAASGFKEMDFDQSMEALARAMAQHVVVGWQPATALDTKTCEEILVETAKESPEVMQAISHRCDDPDTMGHPRLVDGVDLGNG